MDTEVTEAEKPFDEVLGNLVSDRRDYLIKARREHLSGSRKNSESAKGSARECQNKLVTLAKNRLGTISPDERAAALEHMCEIIQQRSAYGLESVGFNPDKFKEDVQEALKAAEEQVKEPSLV